MTRHNQPRLFLASRSPRRRQLLTQAGWQFESINADIDETPHEDEQPIEYVKRMAREKAWTATQSLLSQQLSTPFCVIGADTIVVDGNSILGKPRDDAEAVIMLTRLRARIHHVYSAIAVLIMKKPTEQFNKPEIIEESCL
jgi:septum formation protein